jgi:hypothetical protein
MKEYPEAASIINRYNLTNGQIGWNEISEMPYQEYRGLMLCHNARAVRQVIEETTRHPNAVINKQAFLGWVG